MGRDKRRNSSRQKNFHKEIQKASREDIPKQDAATMHAEGFTPMQHGGIYEEMGADFTFEENVVNTQDIGDRWNVDGKRDAKIKSDSSAMGWLAFIFAIISLFIWPFWLGLTALALSYISMRQGTRHLALVSSIVACISILMSIITSFSM